MVNWLQTFTKKRVSQAQAKSGWRAGLIQKPRRKLRHEKGGRSALGSGGSFLFGEWCAADIMYAPVVTRLITYSIPLPPFAELYMKAVLSHPGVNEWIDKAQDEPWVIEQYEHEAA